MKKLIVTVISLAALSSCVFAPFSKGYHAYGKDAHCKCMMYPELPNHLMDVATQDKSDV